MAYKITFARRSSPTQPRQVEIISREYGDQPSMIEAFKKLATDPDVTTLGAYEPDGATISDPELQRLTGYTGRYEPA